MTILDICAGMDDLDQWGVIFAEQIAGDFAPNSRAELVVLSAEDFKMPIAEVASRRCPGLCYCLEMSIAKEAVAVWSHWRNGQRPNAQECAEAVCYKANTDAWGPLTEHMGPKG